MRKIAFGIAAVTAAIASPAFAGTASNTMPVSVNVLNSCTVSATPMAFGSPTQIGGTAIDSTSTITLSCTTGAAYEVALNSGLNAVAGQRYMAGNAVPANTVPYNIFSDSLRSAAWGSTSGTDTVSGTASSGAAFTLTAYGRIPASAASVPADSYNDTVTVTVTF